MNDIPIYYEAVKVIKEAILYSQYRATASVNKEQLSLYYGIGRYVSNNSRKGFWGKGAIETISQQLQKELPGLRGFSASNIKFMRQFYETWCEDMKSLTTVSGIGNDKSPIEVSEIDTQLLASYEKTDEESIELENKNARPISCNSIGNVCKAVFITFTSFIKQNNIENIKERYDRKIDIQALA